MNRTRYRAFLVSVLIAAIAFGVFYYVYLEKQERTITDGTLVYHIEREDGEGISA